MTTKIILFLLLFFTLLPIKTTAQRFSSPSYLINWGNFNLTSGSKTSPTYRLTDTVGQNAPGYSEGSSLAVKSGFQYIYDTFDYLSFTIDKLLIDFGTLEAGIGVTDTNILTVTTPSGRGYQITAHEDHSLWQNPNIFIPDTTCDNNNCDSSHAAIWTRSDKYGFGFNAQGDGTLSYFPASNLFRPFANINQSQTPAVISTETTPVKNHQTLITYKVIVSPDQSAGDYQTYVTYTLTPNY